MPAYLYKCTCGEEFEVIKPMALSSEKERCPACKSTETYRDYAKEKKSAFVAQTVGMLADRNADRLSDDEKRHLQEKTRRGE